MTQIPDILPDHRRIRWGRTWGAPSPTPCEYACPIERTTRRDTVASWVFSILLGGAAAFGLFFWLSR